MTIEGVWSLLRGTGDLALFPWFRRCSRRGGLAGSLGRVLGGRCPSVDHGLGLVDGLGGGEAALVEAEAAALDGGLLGDGAEPVDEGADDGDVAEEALLQQRVVRLAPEGAIQ